MFMIDALKKIFGQQDSKAGEANAKDLGYTIKLLAIGAALVAAKTFLTGLMDLDLGVFDKAIDAAIAGAVLWVEARQTDNS
jgi:hypothetical protein